VVVVVMIVHRKKMWDGGLILVFLFSVDWTFLQNSAAEMRFWTGLKGIAGGVGRVDRMWSRV